MTTSAGELARVMSMRTLNITITAAMFDSYGERYCVDRMTVAIGIARNFGGKALVISFDDSKHLGMNQMVGRLLHIFTRDGVKTRLKWNKNFLNLAIYLNQPVKAPQNG